MATQRLARPLWCIVLARVGGAAARDGSRNLVAAVAARNEHSVGTLAQVSGAEIGSPQ